MAKDLYAVLGVPKGADASEIKKSFRKLAARLHPDRNPGDAAAESRFKEINHANDVLSDPRKRALYDEFGEEGLREGFQVDQARAYKEWQSRGGGRGPGGGAASGRGSRMEDIFGGEGSLSDLFGDIFSRGRSPQSPAGAGARKRSAKGQDLQGEVAIDFGAAVRGATVQLTLEEVGTQPISVRIPPGANDGARVRVPGHGAPSRAPNGTPGDLLLTIHVRPHDHFRREGDDLHLDLPLTVAEAYQGAKVRVPTADGSVSMKVPPRTQSGQKLRIKGKGVARKGHPAGDLYVHFRVVIPTSDEPAIARAIDELGRHQVGDPREGIEL